jgi:hypothetical protein
LPGGEETVKKEQKKGNPVSVKGDIANIPGRRGRAV